MLLIIILTKQNYVFHQSPHGFMTLVSLERQRNMKKEAFPSFEISGNKSRREKIIDAIAGCILATKAPQKPKSLLEEIICDADT